MAYHNDLKERWVGVGDGDAAGARGGLRAGGAGDGGGRAPGGGQHLGTVGHRHRRPGRRARRRSRWGRCGPPWPARRGARPAATSSSGSGTWFAPPAPTPRWSSSAGRCGGADDHRSRRPHRRRGRGWRDCGSRTGPSCSSSPRPSSRWPASAAHASSARARPRTSSTRPRPSSTAGWISTPDAPQHRGLGLRPAGGRRSGRAAPAPSAPPTAGSSASRPFPRW